MQGERGQTRASEPASESAAVFLKVKSTILRGWEYVQGSGDEERDWMFADRLGKFPDEIQLNSGAMSQSEFTKSANRSSVGARSKIFEALAIPSILFEEASVIGIQFTKF